MSSSELEKGHKNGYLTRWSAVHKHQQEFQPPRSRHLSGQYVRFTVLHHITIRDTCCPSAVHLRIARIGWTIPQVNCDCAVSVPVGGANKETFEQTAQSRLKRAISGDRDRARWSETWNREQNRERTGSETGSRKTRTGGLTRHPEEAAQSPRVAGCRRGSTAGLIPIASASRCGQHSREREGAGS